MMSREEMQEIMDAGLHNDTYFAKQDALRSRKEGWKVFAVNPATASLVVEERGFASREKAIAFIARCGMQDRWIAREASPQDDDYYTDGEKGYYADMPDEDGDYRYDE